MAAEDAISSASGAAATAKRKAEEAAAGEECPLKARTTKPKVDAASIGLPEAAEADAVADAEKAAAAGTIKGDEAGPEKRKTRLPQEEVDWILAQAVDTSRAPRLYSALRSRNPDLVPSPEEETDKSKVALYTAARVYYESRASFAECQARVRGQLHDKGYVEVDDEAIARRAELRAFSERARKEVFEGFSLTDSDEED